MTGFLNVTTSEKKNGFLSIEGFGKLIKPQNYGHPVIKPSGHFHYS
jgi:hypothetical protein